MLRHIKPGMLVFSVLYILLGLLLLDVYKRQALRLLTCFHKKTLLGKTSFSPMEKYILPNSAVSYTHL